MRTFFYLQKNYLHRCRKARERDTYRAREIVQNRIERTNKQKTNKQIDREIELDSENAIKIQCEGDK